MVGWLVGRKRGARGGEGNKGTPCVGNSFSCYLHCDQESRANPCSWSRALSCPCGWPLSRRGALETRPDPCRLGPCGRIALGSKEVRFGGGLCWRRGAEGDTGGWVAFDAAFSLLLVIRYCLFALSGRKRSFCYHVHYYSVLPLALPVRKIRCWSAGRQIEAGRHRQSWADSDYFKFCVCCLVLYKYICTQAVV